MDHEDVSESARRLNRLAERAKKLDDVIKKAAEMQKQIVAEIQKIGIRDRMRTQKSTSIPKSRKPRRRK